jgi:thiosulfate/3-mercaptopyruvate sulfurtransferase
MAQHSPVINIEDINQLKSNNLVFVDATNRHHDNDFKKIEGLIYFDLNNDLSATTDDSKNGGRHPLPTLESFKKTLFQKGISPNQHLIIFDEKQNANAASRLWWMLKAIGHEKVQVLNGGFQKEIKSFFKMKKIEEKNDFLNYQAKEWLLKTTDLQQVKEAINSNEYIIIDVRESTRFNGEHEPIDLVAGHIPTAINIPFSENIDKNGHLLEPHLLKEKYASIYSNYPSNKIIVHCGSGVTACHTLLALAYAGFELPKLYVGSWSEWSRNL